MNGFENDLYSATAISAFKLLDDFFGVDGALFCVDEVIFSAFRATMSIIHAVISRWSVKCWIKSSSFASAVGEGNVPCLASIG